jgi:hypothetical protein
MTNIDSIRFAFFIVFLGVLVSQNARSQSESPAWEFKTGDRFTVTTTKSVKRTSKLDSRVTTVESDVELQFAWNVIDVSENGNAKIEQSLEKFSIRVGDPAVPRQAIAFASDSNPQELSPALRKLQRRAKPMIGLATKFSMQTKGTIQDIVLSDESVAKLKKLDDSPRLQALFDESVLKQSMSSFSLNAVPAELVGGRWSKRENKNDGTIVQHEFVLGDAVQIKDRKMATISVTTTQVLPKKDSPVEGAGSRSEPEKEEKATDKNQIVQNVISVLGNGKINFDTEARYFPSSEYISTIVSERKYREKILSTTVKSSTRMKIEKR